MRQSREQAIFAGLLVVFAVATRIIFNELHLFNFNAVMAAGLFGGAYLTRHRFGFAIPLVAMLATDLVIGVYDWKLMSFVYGALAISVLLGKFYAKDATLLRYAGVVLGGSALFFAVTNGAVWLFGDGTFYPHTLSGLVECYTMGLPFYKNTLIGDLTWTTVLFGSYELFRLKAPKPSVQSVQIA
jgi:hypothetical protein